MTATSLFNIILKILGIFFLRDFIAAMPQILAIISMMINYSDGGPVSPLVAGLLYIAAYGYIAFVLIFKTSRVIEILKLSEGMEEGTLNLNIHRSIVLNISIIVIGSLLVINAIPNLLRQLFLIIQNQKENYDSYMPEPDKTLMVIYIAQIVIGLLLLGSHRKMVSYIELKRRAG